MKKITCFLLILYIISVQSFANASAEDIFSSYNESAEYFSDMGGFEWAIESAEYLSKRGIISGVGNNMFMPQRLITRKEFIKLVCNTCGIVDDNAASSYEDVPTDDWSYIYVSSAKKAGMLDIYNFSQLGANVEITREDMAYVAIKALEFAKMNFAESAENRFSDDDAIEQYAKKAVYALKAQGIVSGRENNEFCPKNNATRAEAAKIIFGILKYVESNYFVTQ